MRIGPLASARVAPVARFGTMERGDGRDDVEATERDGIEATDETGDAAWTIQYLVALR